VGSGIGVAIYNDGPYGPAYGHGGWIPGYCSSLRYYPKHRIAFAFQINTDIGMVDGSTSLINDMEKQLARIVVDGIR
jgi:D-alanyl-D-alanine carboxypeptidase